MYAPAVNIGTSGWHYEHWKNVFYPPELSPREWLDCYSNEFITVEINNTFYHLPDLETVRDWRKRTPEGFLFTAKASRYITHMKKLKDPDPPVFRFLNRIRELKGKLGPVLFQLPPHWKCNRDRLAAFLDVLPEAYQYAFEFRDRSWWTGDIVRLLEENGAAFCIYELAEQKSPKWCTADFVFIRLHGPAGAYKGLYDSQSLSGWAGAISSWKRAGKAVFCYFDNDQHGYAVENARMLRNMLHQHET